MGKCWIHSQGEYLQTSELHSWGDVIRIDLKLGQILLNHEDWLELDQGHLGYQFVIYKVKTKTEHHWSLVCKEEHVFSSFVPRTASGCFFLMLKLSYKEMAGYSWLYNENTFSIASKPVVQLLIPKNKTSVMTCFIKIAYTALGFQLDFRLLHRKSRISIQYQYKMCHHNSKISWYWKCSMC